MTLLYLLTYLTPLPPAPKQKAGMDTMQLSHLHPPPPPAPSYQLFIRFVCCFSRNTLSTLLQKVMHLARKTVFFFHLIAGWFWFCSFDVFLWALFHRSAIMKLTTNSFRQIMWHNKIINAHGLKITSYCCFFDFWGNQVWGWYYLHDFKLLESFRECK